VDDEDKASLRDLVERYGQPKRVVASDATTPDHNDYHEGKAIYVNESGLYAMILGSKKPEAKSCTGRYETPGAAVGEEEHERRVVLAVRKTALKQQLRLRRMQGLVLARLEAIQEQQRNELAVLRDEQRQQTQLHAKELACRMEKVLGCVLGARLANQTFSFCTHVGKVVGEAVRAAMTLKKSQSKALPEDQRATTLQAGQLALGLSTVALGLDPSIPFLAWRKTRASVGHHAKQERLRRHALGEGHAQYVAQPLLWAFAGPTVEGGGARYVYTQDQREMLVAVLLEQRATTAARGAQGAAPTPTESLMQRMHRFAAYLTEQERAVPWPAHAAELEPSWDELRVN
jgi:hypothetical protein